MAVPAPDYTFPNQDEVADYLETYAETNKLPIRHGVRVESLRRNGVGYELVAGTTTYHATNVIIATGPYQQPHTPRFAGDLNPTTFQQHSSAYHNPAQIPVGTVLAVGAGNSDAEIALELPEAGKRVWPAGRDVGHIPAETLGRFLGGRPYWWPISHVLSVDTPIGRKMRSTTESPVAACT